MADPRIIDVSLDDRTIIWRNADVEQERRIAIFDLLENNRFEPSCAHPGPYRLTLRVEEGRLAMDVAGEDGQHADTITLALTPFRRQIREYFAICASYYKAIRQATVHEIETIDMARRAIHDDAASQLRERLEGKVTIDFGTARRLFTLICVLHIRG